MAGDDDSAGEDGKPSHLATVSASNARLVLEPATWIHRRVESISFTDRLTVKRRLSIDFTIPGESVPLSGSSGSAEPAEFWLPVALLRKWPPLMKLDLTSGGGDPLPLLTTGKNREVDAAVLKALWKDRFEVDALPDEMTTALDTVARSSRSEATAAVLDARRALIARALTEGDGAEAFARERVDPFLAVAATLAENSVFWARVTGRPGERQLVKVAFEDPVRVPVSLRRRIFASLSWQAIVAEYEIPHIGNAGIYHCQIDPPPDLEVRTARLVLDHPPLVTVGDDGPGTDPETPSLPPLYRLAGRALKQAVMRRFEELFDPGPPDVRGEPTTGTPYERVTPGRAHLYVSGARKSFGIASVRMAVAPRTLTTKAIVACFALALLMTVAAAVPGSAVDDAGVAATTLLLVPGLLGFLAQPRENPLVSKYLVGVRAVTLVAAACPTIAAVSLLGADDAGDVRCLWIALAIVDWLAVAALIPSRLLPAPARRLQP